MTEPTNLDEHAAGSPIYRVLLTVEQFCSRYSVSRSEVYRQRKTGRLPFIKIGKASRIAMEDAEAWLANLRQAEGRNG